MIYFFNIIKDTIKGLFDVLSGQFYQLNHNEIWFHNINSTIAETNPEMVIGSDYANIKFYWDGLLYNFSIYQMLYGVCVLGLIIAIITILVRRR